MLAVAAVVGVDTAGAADPPRRNLLGRTEREVVLAWRRAVERAQDVDAAPGASFEWENYIFKGTDQTAYVPFCLAMRGAGDGFASTAMSVRVVSHLAGWRASEDYFAWPIARS